MKMPNTLAKINEIIRDAGSPLEEMTGQILRDDRIGYFLRVHLLLQNGESQSFDTREPSTILEQAAITNELEVLH